MTTKTTGYTLEEYVANGFYNWTLISSRIANADDLENDYKGCEYYEDCPCCNCGNTVVVVETFARPRWSKSGKRFVEETTTVWSCSGHASK